MVRTRNPAVQMMFSGSSADVTSMPIPGPIALAVGIGLGLRIGWARLAQMVPTEIATMTTAMASRVIRALRGSFREAAMSGVLPGCSSRWNASTLPRGGKSRRGRSFRRTMAAKGTLGKDDTMSTSIHTQHTTRMFARVIGPFWPFSV